MEPHVLQGMALVVLSTLCTGLAIPSERRAANGFELLCVLFSILAGGLGGVVALGALLR